MVIRTSLLVGMLWLMATARAHAQDMSPYEECWKGSFTEQSTGQVRPRTNRGGRPGDFMSTYDGDFRWSGEPTRIAVAIEYVYCFHQLDERGGAVLMGTQTIPMGRVGSLVLPGTRNSVMGDDSTVIRDPDVFAALYAVFEPQGAEPTSLEISLDRQARQTTVTTLTRSATQRTLVYMKGPAIRLHP